MLRFGLVGLAIIAATAPLRAAGAIEQEEQAVQAWGDTHNDCTEWSDRCVVCKRTTSEAACSLPGIACTPEPIACLKVGPGQKI